MTLYDEVNMLMEKLTEAWGIVVIVCANGRCIVSDGNQPQYTAPTLLEALQKAEQAAELENTP